MLLLEVVKEGIEQYFGESVARVLFFHMETKCGVKRNEIMEKPEVFHNSLEKLLGPGASVMEQFILRNLQSRFEQNLDAIDNRSFVECVREIKARLEKEIV